MTDSQISLDPAALVEATLARAMRTISQLTAEVGQLTVYAKMLENRLALQETPTPVSHDTWGDTSS